MPGAGDQEADRSTTKLGWQLMEHQVEWDYFDEQSLSSLDQIGRHPGDVRRDQKRLSPHRLDLRLELAHLVVPALRVLRQHYMRSSPRQPESYGPPDTLGRPCDNRNFVAQSEAGIIAHAPLPLVSAQSFPALQCITRKQH
jgi:hypothetical protein